MRMINLFYKVGRGRFWHVWYLLNGTASLLHQYFLTKSNASRLHLVLRSLTTGSGMGGHTLQIEREENRK